MKCIDCGTETKQAIIDICPKCKMDYSDEEASKFIISLSDRLVNEEKRKILKEVKDIIDNTEIEKEKNRLFRNNPNDNFDRGALNGVILFKGEIKEKLKKLIDSLAIKESEVKKMKIELEIKEEKPKIEAGDIIQFEGGTIGLVLIDEEVVLLKDNDNKDFFILKSQLLKAPLNNPKIFAKASEWKIVRI